MRTVEDWKAKQPESITSYDAKDIFNMDKSGVFYRALPSKTLRVKGDECKVGKKLKDRITADFCCNVEGDFEKKLSIGKSKKPRCFRNISSKNLSVTWKANKKAWMTSDIFLDWLKQFDRRMQTQGRRVLLFIVKAPSHPKDFRLSNVKVVFIPANTTSLLQPLDQGIIAALKNYRKRLLKAVLTRMDRGEDILKTNHCVTVLDACLWIDEAVREVTVSTVRACFAKAGLPNEIMYEDPADNAVPLS